MRLLLIAAIAAAGCGGAPSPPPAPVAVTRPLGTWEGRGPQTLGFTSESGRLRIEWQARAQQPSGSRFRLTLHSAVSGRPLHLIADHAGHGGDTVDVEDDPRPFTLMVDSTDVEWRIRVEETIAASPR